MLSSWRASCVAPHRLRAHTRAALAHPLLPPSTPPHAPTHPRPHAHALQLRVEDFRAGWAAGGVKLGSDEVAMMRGAYGEDPRSIRYGEVCGAGEGQERHAVMGVGVV